MLGVIMTSMQIREKFLIFFKERGHTLVPSSSLIPAQDPTLLFSNAGMNQFKDLFLGLETRSYCRAASIQKCMRAGGKHSDLDNVGFTKRHLTFFEMMGNFSFGDYFKEDALKFAWDFLTTQMHFDPKNLYATVYIDDNESYDIWHKKIGLPEERISRLGESDNFWSMGDTGPCGACSEIYVDRGPSTGCGALNCKPGCSCDRFMEVWNMVFMQYDRQEDGTLKPLKRVGVDTGMGFERLCSVAQNVDSVYQTDLFIPLIQKIEKLTNTSYAQQTGLQKAAFHVLADHIRACSFLIADGCAPSNDGRGYVLRKIIRRAALFAQKLTSDNIFPELSRAVVELMSPIYPELAEQQKNIMSVLKSEVEKFSINLIHGQHILQKYMAEQAESKVITGKQAFTLYDTYGFPLELTQLIAQEHNFMVDSAGFGDYMKLQQEQSGKKTHAKQVELPDAVMTEFTGYADLATTSTVLAFIDMQNNLVDQVAQGQSCWVIPAQSPFYVERGGQVSDQGVITFADGLQAQIQELKWVGNAIAIKITAPGDLFVGQKVIQQVSESERRATMKNHTATHLLQAALMQLLGKQIKQSGSLVAPDYLRFDFTYHENLSMAQINDIEKIVNQKIQENILVTTTLTTYKEAIDKGVIAFFGDKYNPDSVRMVDVPGFSTELCGGTHVSRTGDIGVFKITEVTALSAGQRRIVAITGPVAVETFQQNFATIKKLTQDFKVKPEEVLPAIQKQKEVIRAAQAEVVRLKKELISLSTPMWIAQTKEIGNYSFLYLHLQDFDGMQLKEIASNLMAKKPAFYFLLSNNNAGSVFYAIMPESYSKDISLADLSIFAQKFNLKGGVKNGSMQGGGPRIDQDISNALEQWLQAAIK